MAASNMVCKDKGMAIAIMDTITKAMSSGTQRIALESVAEWIQSLKLNLPDTPEERRAMAQKIKTELRDCMSAEERKAEAAFYLDKKA